MKKLLIVFSLFSICAEAQTSPDTIKGYLSYPKDFRPKGKDWTVEVNLNPFNATPISISYLRFRYFSTRQSAARLGISIANNSDSPAENVSTSVLNLDLRLGYEHHLLGTERLSPYLGFEVGFGLRNSSYSDSRPPVQGASGIVSIDGATDPNGANQGYTAINAAFVMGADYYIAKRLYLGLELGYGLQYFSHSDITVTPMGGTSLPATKGGTSWAIGPVYNSAIRLGFVF